MTCSGHVIHSLPPAQAPKSCNSNKRLKQLSSVRESLKQPFKTLLCSHHLLSTHLLFLQCEKCPLTLGSILFLIKIYRKVQRMVLSCYMLYVHSLIWCLLKHPVRQMPSHFHFKARKLRLRKLQSLEELGSDSGSVCVQHLWVFPLPSMGPSVSESCTLPYSLPGPDWGS